MKKISVKDMAEIGVLAALVFVATFFLKIGPIPTPAGATMLKTGNAVCLLGAMLFGKIKGALAAGIGSMLYDLTDPAFTASAPFTFVFFFIMAFMCGAVTEKTGGKSTRENVFGAVLGAVSYIVLSIGKAFVILLLGGSEPLPALAACSTKLITSGLNGAFAVAVSVIFAPIFAKALNKKYKRD